MRAAPQPTLRARPDGAGWRLDGVSPFVSGWGRINVLHAAARTDDDEIVWLLVDAAAGPSLRVDRIRLAALALGVAALMTTEGSRSLLLADHAQLLVRDATFTLVYALRPASRAALLASLGA